MTAVLPICVAAVFLVHWLLVRRGIPTAEERQAAQLEAIARPRVPNIPHLIAPPQELPAGYILASERLTEEQAERLKEHWRKHHTGSGLSLAIQQFTEGFCAASISTRDAEAAFRQAARIAEGLPPKPPPPPPINIIRS